MTGGIFFRDGLRFACQRCGACCSGAPGLVYIDKTEAEAIGRWLGRAPETVGDIFIPLNDGYRIREHPDGRCWFFDDGCRIYPLRPAQCRIYPFWLDNLRSEYRWRQAARQCPGIGQGRRHAIEEILDKLALDRRLVGCAERTE